MNDLVKIGRILKTLTVIAMIVYSVFVAFSVITTVMATSSAPAQTNFILSLDSIRLVFDNTFIPVSASDLILSLTNVVVGYAFALICLIIAYKIFDIFSKGEALTRAISTYLKKVTVIAVISGIIKNVLSFISRYLLIERLDHGNALVGGKLSECTLSYKVNLDFVATAVLIFVISKILDLACEYKEKADLADSEKASE